MDCIIEMLYSDLRHARRNKQYRSELLRADQLHYWMEVTCEKIARHALPLERPLLVCAIGDILKAHDEMGTPEQFYCNMLNQLITVYVIRDELSREGGCAI